MPYTPGLARQVASPVVVAVPAESFHFILVVSFRVLLEKLTLYNCPGGNSPVHTRRSMGASGAKLPHAAHHDLFNVLHNAFLQEQSQEAYQ